MTTSLLVRSNNAPSIKPGQPACDPGLPELLATILL